MIQKPDGEEQREPMSQIVHSGCATSWPGPRFQDHGSGFLVILELEMHKEVFIVKYSRVSGILCGQNKTQSSLICR